MALKIRIAKGDYEALDDSLKTQYIADGDGYKLDADYEDVTGLKAKRDELLSKLAQYKDFEGLDAKDVKAKLAALAEKENEDLAAKGKWEELEQKLRAKHAEEVEAVNTRLKSLIDRTAEAELTAKVAPKIKEDQIRGFVLELKNDHIKHVEENGKLVWKTLDDTETVDLDKYISGLSDSKAGYFKSDLGAGSGASGSGNGNGGQKQDLSSLPATARLTQLFEQNK